MTAVPSHQPTQTRVDQHRSCPLVSVLMATFNCADTVDQAIASIVDQTYSNWELVLCDDGSTDGTYARLEHWARLDQVRIRVLRNERNRKLAYSLNRCLAEARGVMVARMDADDRCAPERLARQVAHLQAHPDVTVVGTAIQRFSALGDADIVRFRGRPGPDSLLSGVPFCHPTVLMRTAAVRAVGGYTDVPRTVRVEDLDLWFKLFAHGYRGANLSEPLYGFREDEAAIRRRTLAHRWNIARTRWAGFRMLNAPRCWYVVPGLELAKVLAPIGCVKAYRQWQVRRHRRRRPVAPW